MERYIGHEVIQTLTVSIIIVCKVMTEFLCKRTIWDWCLRNQIFDLSLLRVKAPLHLLLLSKVTCVYQAAQLRVLCERHVVICDQMLISLPHCKAICILLTLQKIMSLGTRQRGLDSVLKRRLTCKLALERLACVKWIKALLLPDEVSDGGPTLQLLRARLLISHACHVDRPGRLVQIAKGLGKTQCGASHIVSMLEKVLGKAE